MNPTFQAKHKRGRCRMDPILFVSHVGYLVSSPTIRTEISQMGWRFILLLPLARCSELSDSLDLPFCSFTALILGVTVQIEA